MVGSFLKKANLSTPHRPSVRLSEAKRRVEAKYIFKVILFNC